MKNVVLCAIYLYLCVIVLVEKYEFKGSVYKIENIHRLHFEIRDTIKAKGAHKS